MSKAESAKQHSMSTSGKDGISEAIGRRLRAVYDDALNEPVPAELSNLIERLSRKADEEKKR